MMSSGGKITKNIVWLMFDQVFILVLQFAVGIKIANYYGAELYGKYNYAVSLVAFSAIFFELLNSRIIKKHYTDDNFNNIVFNVNFFRNTMAGIIFFIPILLKLTVGMDNLLFYMLLLICLDNILTTATYGIENFFEFKLESRRVVISNNIVKIISYTLQYVGMLFGMGIIAVPAIRCIGSLIRMGILKFQYQRTYLSKLESLEKRVDRGLLLSIIDEGKFLWVTYISFLVYTQVDRLMIKQYLGVAEVGIYTIGVQLSAILAILLAPVQNSLFPKMMELYRRDYKEYYNFYLFSNTLITQFYLVVTVISIFVVKLLFGYVYAQEYTPAIGVYSILAVSIFIKANGSLQTGHMTLKNITKKSFYKTLISLVINIVLNAILIPRYGIDGAAIATLITQFTALFLIDFFIEEYREQAWIQLKSFNSFYLLKELIKKYRVKKGGKNV
jgi:O-antigen/teichoic acid export membrane protein